ncbi:UxaA family hydrolase [Candidatus Hydrogenedentota bacterium]
MQHRAIKLHADDDLLVALVDLLAGETVNVGEHTISLLNDVPAKHKVAVRALPSGAAIRMYGVVVGKAACDIAEGALITTDNICPAREDCHVRENKFEWKPPELGDFGGRTFDGYLRSDGRVGTANHWIVVPLTFCENRNILTLRDAFLEELGYRTSENPYRAHVRSLVQSHFSDKSPRTPLTTIGAVNEEKQAFPNVDGIQFIAHSGGCGATRQDAKEFCGLLAGYIDHPNVAGATVLGLGCQNSQVSMLEEELHRRNPGFDKPLYIFEQQTEGTNDTLLGKAIEHTFSGLIDADKCRREPVPFSELVVGVECGASDGFSGISANPVIGICADLIVAAGGTVILSEFPELSGVEQALCDRCVDTDLARRFLELMREFESRLEAVGSSFDANPSPGNIRDGLLTDAMKSAGAALKGGSSPIMDVLDYPEPVRKRGLNLLNTPGGDVESTTAMVGSGANLILFSTGAGTPTGNPIVPVIKVSSNSDLSQRMSDLIDFDAGTTLTGADTHDSSGRKLLELCIETASRKYSTKAVLLGQDDFIPWKRGYSL